ncbi:MAG: hypothetical protein HZA20_14390 [Nitrospirae bacterium]|nr:hypothetical protein [Nitrospirota bacterium]
MSGRAIRIIIAALLIGSGALAESPSAPASGGVSIGQRIADYAETFIGRPYDTDPLGEYVRREVVVADERVDCMYLTFRAIELALSSSPEEAVEKALELRFPGRGRMENGRIVNYDERFQYGEDMIDSGKFGREITAKLGPTTAIAGSRGRGSVRILDRATAIAAVPALSSGDIIYFIKDPAKRVVGEIVGHIGFVSRETTLKPAGTVYLIHAGGRKKSGGSVKKVSLEDYLTNMQFIGIRITRFEQAAASLLMRRD